MRGRWPVAAWDGITHIQWGYRILRKTDASAADLQRAHDAIAWLECMKDAPETVAVVTHGVFRRLLAIRLTELRWQALSRPRSYKHWSVWSFASLH